MTHPALRSLERAQSEGDVYGPEDAKGVAAMAASLFAETRGVADVFQGELTLFKPLLPVHRTQRLL